MNVLLAESKCTSIANLCFLCHVISDLSIVLFQALVPLKVYGTLGWPHTLRVEFPPYKGRWLPRGHFKFMA